MKKIAFAIFAIGTLAFAAPKKSAAKKSVVDSVKEKAAVWFMAQTDKAEVKSVVATSELVEAQFDGKYLYPPINILDGDFNSTWCEADKNGSGIGESITVEFSEPVSFDEFQIVNGFASKDYYKKNNRVKSIVLTQVAKEHFQQKEYNLEDDKPDWQSIKFALPQTAQTITIKITGVYKGTKYDDTCLDDIRLLYKGKVIPFTGVAELKKVQEENSKIMLKSSAADFKKQFYALFDGGTKIFLKAKKGKRTIVVAKREEGNSISYVEETDYLNFIKNGTESEVFNQFMNMEPDYNRSYYIHDDKGGGYDLYYKESYEKAKSAGKEFLLAGCTGDPYWGRRTSYSLGNFRINKTEMIDYVETTTAIIIKIEGNTIYWNGVPYTVFSEKQVEDIRYSDGP